MSRYILDSSDEEEYRGALKENTAPRRRDSLLDDSSDDESFQALLQNIRIQDAAAADDVKEEESVEEETDDIGDYNDDSSSSGESEDEVIVSTSIANIPTSRPLQIPTSLYEKLYDHQKTGVQWMAGLTKGGLLGDDMGMGKTYMTLTFLGGLLAAGTIRNALIVAPISVLRSWETEAKLILSQCCNVTIHVVASTIPTHRRQAILQQALNNDRHFVIAPYSLVANNPLHFVTTYNGSDTAHFDYVVLDEGHTIKNVKTKVNRGCHRICKSPSTHRLLLTGTPILNNLMELWALFDFCCPKLLKSAKQFHNAYSQPIEAARSSSATDWEMNVARKLNQQLQAKLQPFFLQRLKADYLADKLPPKYEVVVWTHLAPRQRELYTDFVNHMDETSPLEAVTWLKKLCGHPVLVQNNPNVLATEDPDRLMEQAPKLDVLVSLVDSFCRDRHTTLVFSQSTRMLDIIQTTLHAKGFSTCRIDGQVAEQRRQEIVNSFNRSNFDVCLVSTQAGGVGLTLTGASRVILYDPSWTPAYDAQAVDRCYRIGQDQTVYVYRLLAAGTVEEKMYEKQTYKDGIRRTIFTIDTVERLFDKKSDLFQLAAPGVCAVRTKCRDHVVRPEYHDLVQYAQVLGISPHNGFYHDETNAFASTVATSNENTTDPETTTPADERNEAPVLHTIDDNSVEEITAGVAAVSLSIDDVVAQVESYMARGQYRRALVDVVRLSKDGVPTKHKLWFHQKMKELQQHF